MKKNILKLLPALAAATTLLPLASCNHKELDFGGQTTRSKTKVVFDWRYAPDADPKSMELCLYPQGSSSHLSFNLTGKDGGYISLSSGVYDAISMNNDDLDWALYRNTDDEDDFEVYTHDAAELGAYKLLAASLPRAEGAETERLATTPEMSWSTRSDNISVSSENGENVITLYPEEIVCHYTVEVKDVGNLGSARGEVVDGTLSGMAEGYSHGSKHSTDTPVTMPFILSIDSESNSLKGEFLTFGECNTVSRHHTLTVYLFLTDGSKWYYTFDVDKQVSEAPDPRHVDIVVSGLTLPKPIATGGLLPDVTDWQTEVVDIKM